MSNIPPHVVFEKTGAEFIHECHEGIIDISPLTDRWQQSEVDDTIHPSISCADCGAHGFWTKGKWYPV